MSTIIGPEKRKITNIKITDVLKHVILKSIPSIVDVGFSDCDYHTQMVLMSPTALSHETTVVFRVEMSLTIDPINHSTNSIEGYQSEIRNIFHFTHPEMSDYVNLVVGKIIYKEKEVENLARKRMREFLKTFGGSL
jgi:hypothetical protein